MPYSINYTPEANLAFPRSRQSVSCRHPISLNVLSEAAVEKETGFKLVYKVSSVLTKLVFISIILVKQLFVSDEGHFWINVKTIRILLISSTDKSCDHS